MKTTGIFKTLMFIAFLAVASPTFASLEKPVHTVVETPEAKISRLQNRLEEIKAMDRNSMTRAERKALKKEVRQIKDEVNALSGGVYISIGAILVIILLLILLL